MTDLETSLRRGLERYAQAVPVARPPLDELLNGPHVPPLEPAARTPRRRHYVVAGAGIAAAAAVAATVVWRGPQDTSSTAISPGCAAGTATDGVVDSGRTRDGQRWDVRVSGQPPTVVSAATAGGRPIGGDRSDQLSWGHLVNQGGLYLHLQYFGGGLLVYGEVPTSTASVELQLADGDMPIFCPTAVPGIDAVRYFAGYVPSQPDIRGVVASDAEGRRVAYLPDPGRISESLPEPSADGVEAGVAIDMRIDPEQVALPLGGDAWPTVSADDLHDVVTGVLPSGPWAARAGGDESVVGVDLVLPVDDSFPLRSGSPQELLAAPLWQIEWVDDRYVVAGLTARAVADIEVTFEDGQVTVIPTHDAAVPGFDGRIFASSLPPGASPTALQGRASDGTVVVEPTDLAGAMQTLPDSGGVAVPVRPVG